MTTENRAWQYHIITLIIYPYIPTVLASDNILSSYNLKACVGYTSALYKDCVQTNTDYLKR